MTALDPELRDSVRDLHAHLEATATHPVTEAANRWLGEAQAVAADAVAAIEAADDPSADVIETRVGQVRDLLREVNDTGSDDADEHVRAARDLADRVLADP